MTCPKCGAARPEGAAECPQCGIIYERHERSAARKRAAMLTTCPACGKEVARQAPTCPGCGQPISAGTADGASERSVDGAETSRKDEKAEAAALAGKVYSVGCGALVLIILAILVFSGGKGDGKSSYERATGKPSPEAAPGTPSTPRTVMISDSAFGCHDIGDFWILVAEARKGDVRNFTRVLNRYADAGKCDKVRAGAATALELLPSGAVRIRDANNALWWVSDASVRL